MKAVRPAATKPEVPHVEPLLLEVADVVNTTLDLETTLRRVAELVRHWTDGCIKMFVTACALRLRRAESDLFAQGDYVPLPASGPKSAHVVAFSRSLGDKANSKYRTRARQLSRKSI